MISEKHDANMIQYWMNEWLRSGGTVPREVITDFSFALLNAVARAFNNWSLSYYIKSCLKCLDSERDAKASMPICVIRLDIAHVIKTVARWQCFHGKASRIKDFYMRCIGFLTTIETKNQFEHILHSLLIVALSESDDKDTECANRQEFLLEMIRNFKVDDVATEDNDSKEYHSLDEVDAAVKNINVPHFEKLRASAENFADKARSGLRPNSYYCPEFVIPFIRFSRYYVLWTNVMIKINKCQYCVASSSRSEAYFNDIKNVTLKPTTFGILIVNNFLTKGVQRKNQIVSKCANKNLSIRAILTVVTVF